MVVTPEALGINRLSIAERISLVAQIWDGIAEEDQSPLTEEERSELDRRADDDDANPDDVIPWDEIKAESLARCRP